MDNYIGRQVVQQGLEKYVKMFAYKNAQCQDLVDCMNESMRANGMEGDLSEWTEDWLKKSGVNTLKLECRQVEGQPPQLDIVQGNTEHGDK